MIRHEPDFSTDRNEILRVIKQVRNRWRLRIVFRGTSVLLAAALGIFLASSFGLEVFRFEPTAVVIFRVLTYAVLIGLGWWFFVRPLLRKVSDEQVALYLEEHEPSLQTSLLSAVEESNKNSEVRRPDYSPKIVDQLIQSAVSSVREVALGRAVARRPLQLN